MQWLLSADGTTEFLCLNWLRFCIYVIIQYGQRKQSQLII